jgi:hypothetical protein
MSLQPSEEDESRSAAVEFADEGGSPRIPGVPQPRSCWGGFMRGRSASALR